MRTKLLALAAIVLSASLFAAYNGNAQAPVPDTDYETNLVVLACNRAVGLAINEGYESIWCRKESEAVNGYRAIVGVRIKLRNAGIYKVTITFQKALWSAQDISAEPE